MGDNEALTGQAYQSTTRCKSLLAAALVIKAADFRHLVELSQSEPAFKLLHSKKEEERTVKIDYIQRLINVSPIKEIEQERSPIVTDRELRQFSPSMVPLAALRTSLFDSEPEDTMRETSTSPVFHTVQTQSMST